MSNLKDSGLSERQRPFLVLAGEIELPIQCLLINELVAHTERLRAINKRIAEKTAEANALLERLRAIEQVPQTIAEPTPRLKGRFKGKHRAKFFRSGALRNGTVQDFAAEHKLTAKQARCTLYYLHGRGEALKRVTQRGAVYFCLVKSEQSL